MTHRAQFISALALAAISAGAMHAQQPTPPASGAAVTLSLDDALKIAQATAQTIDIARSGIVRASGTRAQVRSQYFPQLNATGSYNRTLKSQFSGLASNSSSSGSNGTGTGTGTGTDTAAKSSGGGFDLSKTSFAAANLWTLGLSFSQNVFTGGRLRAQNDAAEANLRSAGIELTAQQAQTSLDVTSAYYDAVLADQLVSIADSSVAETEAVLSQTRLAKQVGNTSEYELLRAQVTRDNQLPVAIQAKTNRDVAYLRLKQLLNLPLDDVLRLTTRIEGEQGPSLPAIAASGQTSDTSAAVRAPVRQLDEAVKAAEAQVRIARAERIPSFQIVSNYQRLYFPSNAFPTLSQGVNNWTIGVSTNFPILDGGRIKGDKMVAEAGVQQAKAQREQTKQFAALDTRVALNALQQAEATWNASRGTADQAQRAYAIDQVRYREGISTQTDLTQSRLLLEQSLANRAQAARNLAVARVKLALLRDLPLTGGTGNAAPSQSAGGAIQQQQQSQQQQAQQLQQQSQNTNRPGAGGTGSGNP
jgi:outer membrane protein